jgi:hypothetical protein
MQIRTPIALASCLISSLAVGLFTLNLAHLQLNAGVQPTLKVQPNKTYIAHRGSGRIELVRMRSSKNLG